MSRLARHSSFSARGAMQMARAWLSGLFILFPVIAFATGQQQDVRELLQLMDKHAATLTYSGTLVYSQGTQMETLKLYHALENGERRERLVHLSGKQRETIRKGSKVLCLDSSGVRTFGRDVPAGPFARVFSENVLSGDSAYRAVLVGESRVAGRPVKLVRLQPKDNYRYGFQLALDDQTQLLLQTLMFDENGEIIERYEYSQIEIGGPLDMALLQPELPMQTATTAPLADNAAADKAVADSNSTGRWAIGWVPSGFMLQAAGNTATEQPMLRSGRDGNLMYSDGLSAFTVFVADNVNLRHQSRRSGATTAYTLVKNEGDSLYSVTVVGEISRLAAEKIAQSVSRVR